MIPPAERRRLDAALSSLQDAIDAYARGLVAPVAVAGVAEQVSRHYAAVAAVPGVTDAEIAYLAALMSFCEELALRARGVGRGHPG